jgi:aspartate kinase
MSMLRIMKFGGTSVGSSEAIAQTARLLADGRRSGDRIVGVVSAMSGVTNTLLDAASTAACGAADPGAELARSLFERHGALIQELVDTPERRARTHAAVRNLAERCGRLIESVFVLRDLSPRVRDLIVSYGERLSAVVVAAVVEELGVSATAVDSDRVIVTDDVFGNATPLLDRTAEYAHEVLLPLLGQGVTPIVTGFFGATDAGAVTTLGRGGSDYSASILAHALKADEIWIWTDVDGVMTADPRLVPDAHTLTAISFSEATEMAYFGAKVIHPRTMQPAAEAGIPIWIKNTFNPTHPGTRIGAESSANGSAKAITAIPNVSVITVEGSGFLGVAGVTARVFSAVGQAGINVFMISQASSQHSLSFVVPGTDGQSTVRVLEAEFELDLYRQRLLRVWEDPGCAIVAVVGAGMRGTPGVAGRVFQTLGTERINISAIAQGSSELNISCVISADRIAQAVPALHRAFHLETPGTGTN